MREADVRVSIHPTRTQQVVNALMALALVLLIASLVLQWRSHLESPLEAKTPQTIQTGDTVVLRVGEQAFLGNAGAWVWVSTDPARVDALPTLGVAEAHVISTGTRLCLGSVREARVWQILSEDQYRLSADRVAALQRELAEFGASRPDSLCAVVRVGQR